MLKLVSFYRVFIEINVFKGMTIPLNSEIFPLHFPTPPAYSVFSYSSVFARLNPNPLVRGTAVAFRVLIRSKPARRFQKKLRLNAGGDLQMRFSRISHSDTQVSNKGNPFSQGFTFDQILKGMKR